MSDQSERADRITNALEQRDGHDDHEQSSITKVEYDELMADRPEKFSAKEVGYRKAPRGSEQRCDNCVHFYTRNADGFHVCEIFRSPETDERGVEPKYLCDWWTSDGDTHPLVKEEE